MIDFHIHTTCSDGKKTPAEVLQMAERMGLTHISITDHYAVAAYEQLRDPAIRSLFSGKIMLGCEYSVHLNGRPVDLLGFGVPYDAADAFIKANYVSLEERRARKLAELKEVYTERGIRFNYDQIIENLKNTQFWQVAYHKELIRFPENVARFSNPKSLTNFKTFLYSEINNPDSDYYIDSSKSLPSIEKVCAFIRENGGISLLAHPGIYDQSTQDLIESMIQTAKPDGLEVWYALHTEAQRAHFMSLCEKYGLIFSIGSDFHNQQREAEGNVLGIPAFQEICPIDEILKWADPLSIF